MPFVLRAFLFAVSIVWCLYVYAIVPYCRDLFRMATFLVARLTLFTLFPVSHIFSRFDLVWFLFVSIQKDPLQFHKIVKETKIKQRIDWMTLIIDFVACGNWNSGAHICRINRLIWNKQRTDQTQCLIHLPKQIILVLIACFRLALALVFYVVNTIQLSCPS